MEALYSATVTYTPPQRKTFCTKDTKEVKEPALRVCSWWTRAQIVVDHVWTRQFVLNHAVTRRFMHRASTYTMRYLMTWIGTKIFL